MTTATLVKLTHAGEMLTLRVDACAPLAMGKYPDVEFSGEGCAGSEPTGQLVALRLPKASADRQLARLSLSYDQTVGKTLLFSRDPNASDASKPFWGITLVGSAAPAAKSNGTNGHNKPQGINLGAPIAGLDDTPEPEPPEDAAPAVNTGTNPAREKLIASFKLYDACLAHAVKCVERHPNLVLDAAAMAATLYIQANK